MPEQHLSEQQFLQNRLEDKFPSITLGYKHNKKVFSYDEMSGRSCFLLRKLSFMDFLFKTLVLFHKNGGNVNNIYEELINVNTYHVFDIILNDFSINALEPKSQVLQVLTNYN